MISQSRADRLRKLEERLNTSPPITFEKFVKASAEENVVWNLDVLLFHRRALKEYECRHGAPKPKISFSHESQQSVAILTRGPVVKEMNLTADGYGPGEGAIFVATGRDKTLLVTQFGEYQPLTFDIHLREVDLDDWPLVIALSKQIPAWADEYPGAEWPNEEALRSIATDLIGTPTEEYDHLFRGKLLRHRSAASDGLSQPPDVEREEH